MEIIISKTGDFSPISIMQLKGALDGSSYEQFIKEAQKLYDAGARDLLVDMTGLTFLSSAGLTALHCIARVFRGEDPAIMEKGWSALRVMSRAHSDGLQKHVKLLNPSARILDVLDMVGFKNFFEIHSDIHPALVSFQ